jgi:hypothetical protein
MVEKGGVSKVFDVFNKGRKEGHLATSASSTWSPWEKDLLALEGLFYTAPTVNKGKSGIDLLLRKYPTSFATDFYLLFLVDLIHVLRI